MPTMSMKQDLRLIVQLENALSHVSKPMCLSVFISLREGIKKSNFPLRVGPQPSTPINRGNKLGLSCAKLSTV